VEFLIGKAVLFVLAGVFGLMVLFIIALFVAMCVAAGEADRRLGYKDVVR
jgi:hypothetical protein